MLISPRICVQKGDLIGSGVPYWPLELATVASMLKQRQYEVEMIDLFGSNPTHLEDYGDHFRQGCPFNEALTPQALEDVDLVVVFALSYMSHAETLAITRHIRDISPELSIAILENSQAVTGYAIDQEAEAFFSSGASALLCGEVYWNWEEIASFLSGKGLPPDNIITLAADPKAPPLRRVNRYPSYPIPSWELFPIEKYWSVPYSHGPKTQRYLPLMTSRGCSFGCDFCVVPATNNRRWRGRDPEEVVQEILTLRERFGVRDFQIEDLNPTTDFKRIKKICELLVACDAGIRFYLVSGTKAETVDLESLGLLVRAGCRYISISPESGSSRLMKIIGKPFDYEHGISLVKKCAEHGIRTQACFVVGHPQETEEDHQKSREYLKRLLHSGLDEPAIFIAAPFAGSKLAMGKQIELISPKLMLSFSPQGRSSYLSLRKRRRELILCFLLARLASPRQLWGHIYRGLRGEPETKLENLPRRWLFMLRSIFASRRGNRET